jgi:hypothetical protein
MEDGFGTIIYIIIAAVALIITALGKKKKQGARAPMRPAGNTTVFDPFSAFDIEKEEPETEFIDEMVDSVEVPPQLTNELDMIIEEGVTAFTKGAVLTENETERLRMEMETDNPEHQPPGSLSQPYKSQKGKSDLEKIMTEFDLKKAIIYSEIINRKKF